MTLKMLSHRPVWRFEDRNQLPERVPDHVRILQSPALAGFFEAKILRQRLLERDALEGPALARDAGARAARRPALREIASRWTDAYLTTTADLLEQGGSQDPTGDARMVVATIDGLILQRLAEDRATSLRAAVNRLVAGLLVAR